MEGVHSGLAAQEEDSCESDVLCELRARLCDPEMISRMDSAKEPKVSLSSCAAAVDSETFTDGGGSSELVGAAAGAAACSVSFLLLLLAGAVAVAGPTVVCGRVWTSVHECA